MKRKGFTLIELIIVIIIIGVLATIAIPQYLKAVEKGKLAKGKAGLALLAQAEAMYRAEYDAYVALSVLVSTQIVELGKVGAGDDGDWTYTITPATTTFTAKAVRKTPSACGGSAISVNQLGTWTGIPPTAGCANWK